MAFFGRSLFAVGLLVGSGELLALNLAPLKIMTLALWDFLVSFTVFWSLMGAPSHSGSFIPGSSWLCWELLGFLWGGSSWEFLAPLYLGSPRLSWERQGSRELLGAWVGPG